MGDEYGFLTLRIPQRELDQWSRLARLKGYSRSELVRLALSEAGIPFAEQLAPQPSGAAYEPSEAEALA